MTLHNTSYTSSPKGLRFLATSIWSQIRKPTTQIMAGMMLLGGVSAKATPSSDIRPNSQQTPVKGLRVQALQTIYTYDYGEVYKRGENPKVDYVSDTAKTSAGLMHGVRVVKGAPLNDVKALNNLMRSDTAYSMNLYRRSYEKLQNDLRPVGGNNGNVKWHSPLEGDLVITSGFGYRKKPTRNASSNHQGIDFRASTGTPVYSVAKTRLVKSGGKSVKYIELDILNEDGIESGYRVQYLHVNPTKDKPGTIYESGQQLTTIGKKDGVSSAAHLDIRLLKIDPKTGAKTYIDPQTVLCHLGNDVYQKSGRGTVRLVDMSTIAKSDMLTGGRGEIKQQMSPFAQEIGRDVAGYILGDKNGNVLARLPEMFKKELNSGKITQAEYEKRMKGIELASNTLRSNMAVLFSDDRAGFKKAHFAMMDNVKNLASNANEFRNNSQHFQAGAPPVEEFAASATRPTSLPPEKDPIVPDLKDAFAETKKALAKAGVTEPMKPVRSFVTLTA